MRERERENGIHTTLYVIIHAGLVLDLHYVGPDNGVFDMNRKWDCTVLRKKNVHVTLYDAVLVYV